MVVRITPPSRSYRSPLPFLDILGISFVFYGTATGYLCLDFVYDKGFYVSTTGNLALKLIHGTIESTYCTATGDREFSYAYGSPRTIVLDPAISPFNSSQYTLWPTKSPLPAISIFRFVKEAVSWNWIIPLPANPASNSSACRGNLYLHGYCLPPLVSLDCGSWRNHELGRTEIRMFPEFFFRTDLKLMVLYIKLIFLEDIPVCLYFQTFRSVGLRVIHDHASSSNSRQSYSETGMFSVVILPSPFMVCVGIQPVVEKITSRHRYIILVFILLLLLRYLYRLFSVELLSGLYNGYFLYRLRWPLNYR